MCSVAFIASAESIQRCDERLRKLRSPFARYIERKIDREIDRETTEIMSSSRVRDYRDRFFGRFNVQRLGSMEAAMPRRRTSVTSAHCNRTQSQLSAAKFAMESDIQQVPEPRRSLTNPSVPHPGYSYLFSSLPSSFLSHFFFWTVFDVIQ